MSKAPRISPSVKAIIYNAAWDDSEKDRRLLAVELQEKLKILNIKSIPAEETLQKMISWARNNRNDPQEKPWNMATLDDHPISPEALPEVLRIWALRMESGISFTIREAKWAARFSAFILPGSQYARSKVSALASKYARLELIYQLIGWPFDSTILDRFLMGVKTEDTVDLIGFIPFIPVIATLVGGEEWLEGFLKDIKVDTK